MPEVFIPRSDPTFTSNDVIRIFERYLDPDERREVENFFRNHLEGDVGITEPIRQAIRDFYAIWTGPDGVNLIIGLIVGMDLAIDAVLELGLAEELNQEREKILAEIDSMVEFLDSLPDELRPLFEVVMFPIVAVLQDMVRLLTPAYILIEAEAATNEAFDALEAMEDLVDVFGPRF